jgi:hypothetical protein
MEIKKEANHLSPNERILEVIDEKNYLKSKVAFSLGALEGISYLLKNDDPLIIKQNLDHLRTTVNRVIEDLRRDF